MRWLVTGATSEIAQAIARRRLEAGDQIVLTARDAASCRTALTLFADAGPRVESFAFDLGAPQESEAALDAVLKAGLDGVVLVAATRDKRLRRFHELTDAEVQQSVLSNILGNAWLLRRVLPSLEARRFGRLVFISSVSAASGTSRYGPYCLTKAALEGLMLNLAVDYGHANVLSNIVRPGIIETGRTRRFTRRGHWAERIGALVPQGQLGTPAQVAEAVDPLLSATSYINGTVLTVAGGLPLMRSEGLLLR